MRFGAATNMITSAMMNVSRSSGIPDLTCIDFPPVVSAPNSSAATTTPLGPESREQRESDRREPDAAREIGRHLPDGADDDQRPGEP